MSNFSLEFEGCLPDKNLSVLAFLAFKLPAAASINRLTRPENSFLTLPPMLGHYKIWSTYPRHQNILSLRSRSSREYLPSSPFSAHISLAPDDGATTQSLLPTGRWMLLATQWWFWRRISFRICSMWGPAFPAKSCRCLAMFVLD